ncbi:hypothetical protein [Streptomyces sp. NPDC052042]
MAAREKIGKLMTLFVAVKTLDPYADLEDPRRVSAWRLAEQVLLEVQPG